MPRLKFCSKKTCSYDQKGTSGTPSDIVQNYNTEVLPRLKFCSEKTRSYDQKRTSGTSSDIVQNCNTTSWTNIVDRVHS